jgi:hypothetical protein
MFSKEDLAELEKKMKQQELEEEQLNERDMEMLKDIEQEKLDKEKKMNTDSQENQVKLRTAKLDEYIINGYLEKIEKHK